MKELVLSWSTVARMEELPHVKDRVFKRGGFTRRDDGSFAILMDDASYDYIMAHGATPDGAVNTMLATIMYRR